MVIELGRSASRLNLTGNNDKVYTTVREFGLHRHKFLEFCEWDAEGFGRISWFLRASHQAVFQWFGEVVL